MLRAENSLNISGPRSLQKKILNHQSSRTSTSGQRSLPLDPLKHESQTTRNLHHVLSELHTQHLHHRRTPCYRLFFLSIYLIVRVAHRYPFLATAVIALCAFATQTVLNGGVPGFASTSTSQNPFGNTSVPQDTFTKPAAPRSKLATYLRKEYNISTRYAERVHTKCLGGDLECGLC